MATTEGYAGSGLDLFSYIIKYVNNSTEIDQLSDIYSSYMYKEPIIDNLDVNSNIYNYHNQTSTLVLQSRSRTGELRSAINLSSRLINGFLNGLIYFSDTSKISDYDCIILDNIYLSYGKMVYKYKDSTLNYNDKLFQVFNINSNVMFEFELIPIKESDILFTYSTGTIAITNIISNDIAFDYFMIPAETELLKLWMIKHLAPWLDISMVEYIDLYTPINFKCTIHDAVDVDLLPLELLNTTTGCYICDRKLEMQNAQSLNKVRYHNRQWYHSKRCNNKRRP